MSSTTPDVRASRLPAIIPALNGLIGRLIGAGMPFGPNVLMTVSGRSTGVPRTFPVALIRAGGRYYVQSPFGEVNWVKNLRASGRAVVTRRGWRQSFDAVELDDAAAASVLREALQPYLRSRLTRRIAERAFHVRAGSSPSEWAAMADGHPTFALSPSQDSEPR